MVNKQSAFNQLFKEVQAFTDDSLQVSAELYTREEAIKMFADYHDADPSHIELFVAEDRVRFGFGYDWDAYEHGNKWWNCASGKGTKPTWRYKYHAG